MLILYIMFGVVASLMVALYVFQNQLLYFPMVPNEARTIVDTPDRFELEYEDVTITTADRVKLHAYLTKQSHTKDAPTLIYFHGNAGNIGHRLQNVKRLHELCGVNVLIVSYRGYGKSEGSPNERGLKMDAQAALDYLLNRPDIDPKKIFVFGRSLGGAVAIDVAHKNPDKFAGVLVENTFTSVENMVDILMPFLSPFKMLIKNRWDSQKIISSVRCPILFLSGLKDELIPPKMMKELFEKSSSQGKHMATFPTGTHNDTWQKGGVSYYSQIKQFLDKSIS